MKKIIYSSAVAALLSASSIALGGGVEIIPIEDYFSGFYVGGTGSVHHATLDGSSSIFNTNNYSVFLATGTFTVPAGALISQDIDGGAVNGYGGIQGGYGWTFRHIWYLGVQGFGEWGSQSKTTDDLATVTLITPFLTVAEISNDGTVTTSTQIKISNDYGVAGKIGYVVAPKTLVYGKIGASWAKIKVDNTGTVEGDQVTAINGIQLATVDTTATGSTSAEKTKLGLLLGIGFEQFVYQDIVSVNVEYNYVNYGTVTTNSAMLSQVITTAQPGLPVTVSNPTPTPIFTQANGSATVNSLLGGINFYFGRGWF
jgi:outer membrane immunogenic protein